MRNGDCLRPFINPGAGKIHSNYRPRLETKFFAIFAYLVNHGRTRCFGESRGMEEWLRPSLLFRICHACGQDQATGQTHQKTQRQGTYFPAKITKFAKLSAINLISASGMGSITPDYQHIIKPCVPFLCPQWCFLEICVILYCQGWNQSLGIALHGVKTYPKIARRCRATDGHRSQKGGVSFH